MILDARALDDMADACRRASDPALVLASEIRACVEACPDGGPGFLRAAADFGTFASRLKQASQLMRDLAQNPDLPGILAHLAAGGSIICVPPMIVVRHEENEALLPADHPGLLAWLRRRFRSLVKAA